VNIAELHKNCGKKHGVILNGILLTVSQFRLHLNSTKIKPTAKKQNLSSQRFFIPASFTKFIFYSFAMSGRQRQYNYFSV
jgi:hypothetical protein